MGSLARVAGRAGGSVSDDAKIPGLRREVPPAQGASADSQCACGLQWPRTLPSQVGPTARQREEEGQKA